MKTQFLIAIFLVSAFIARSQQGPTAVSRLYDSALIHQYSNSKWMQGDRMLKKGELRKLLREHPSSAAEYRKHKKNRDVAAVIYVVGGSAYVASLFIIPYNPEVAFGTMLGALVPAFVALPFSIKADRSLRKSVRLYNRAILTGDTVSVR